MTTSIFVSISLKNEILWDFANYHYYNAWAFFNNRLNYDIVPASFNTFLNPIIDIPLYLYIQYFNDMPSLIWALQGIWGGLMLFCTYKITSLFLDYRKTINFLIFSALCLVILTGEGVGTQLGSSANEIPVAFLILWGFYVLLKMIKFPDTQKIKKFFYAGLIMGIGLGLKQTVVTYCLSSGLILIICYKYLNKPCKDIFSFALGGLSGYLIINGYFMYQYWILYNNPFFPFLNNIFHSTYFEDFNYRDTRFLPTLKNFLIYPFLWYGNGYKICENYYIDIRLTIYYVVFMIFGLIMLCSKKQRQQTLRNKPLTILFIFLVLSFFLWLFLFSYMRYAVVIEVIGAILTMLLIIRFLPQKNIPFILYNTFWIILIGILYINFGSIYHTTENKQKIFVEPITLPENSLVKLYGLPTAGLVPFLQNKEKNIRALGYMQHHCKLLKGTDLAERNQFRKMRDQIDKNHNGPIIFVYTEPPTIIKHLTLQKHKELSESLTKLFNCETWPLVVDTLIKDMPNNYECKRIQTNIMNTDPYLCFPQNLKNTIFKNSEKTNE